MIAVGSDERSGTGGGKVKVYEYSEMARRWQVKEVQGVVYLRRTSFWYFDTDKYSPKLVETFSTLTDPVHDLAFAPNIGRSYHVLGIAGRCTSSSVDNLTNFWLGT